MWTLNKHNKCIQQGCEKVIWTPESMPETQQDTTYRWGDPTRLIGHEGLSVQQVYPQYIMAVPPILQYHIRSCI